LIGKLLSQTVAGKLIQNDDKINDMLNYTIGTIKCFSTANKAVQEEAVNCQLVQLLSLAIKMIIENFKASVSKKAQILV
jgi:hypothetical protein